MKPYPLYKDCGVEWIGEIPNHWFVNKVSRNTYVKGRIGWKGLTSDEFIDDGPYLITGTDFKKGRIDWENTYHVSQERYEEDPFIILKEGDVLITKDGTIGKIVYVDYLPSQTTLNSGIFVTRPVGGEYEPLFFYWLLNSNVFRIFIDYESNGSTIQHLYQNVFEDFKFSIPPLPEQKQIVSFLDHKTQKIDELIEKTERKIELLKEKRISLINHCVTKGLTPEVEMKDSGVEWIGAIPSGWKIGRLTKFILPVVDYRGRTPKKTEDGVFLLTARNIRNGKIDYFRSTEFTTRKEKEKLDSRGVPEISDVIFTTEAPLGQVANVDRTDVAIAQRIVKFRGKKDVLDNYFLKYWILSDMFQQDLVTRSTGSTATGIKASKFGLLYLIVPSLQEQHQIVDYLDKQTQKIDSTIKKETKRIELLKEYRQSLISEVVTGKVDVRDWKN